MVNQLSGGRIVEGKGGEMGKRAKFGVGRKLVVRKMHHKGPQMKKAKKTKK